MKKIAVLFLSLFVFSICAGFAKKRDKESGVRIAPSASVYENDVSETSEEEQNYEQNFVQDEDDDNEGSTTRKERKEAKKEAKQLKKKGWEISSSKTIVKRNGKNMEVVQGIAKMKTMSQNGSVAFYVAGPKNAWFPIVETSDFAESTYVSLFVDGIEHRLNRSRITDYYFEVDDNSITVTYTISRLAELKVTYKFAESKNNSLEYENASVLVSYSLMNIDRMEHSFVLKVVYNTVLGENSKAHFNIASNPEVISETIMIPSEQNRYVISSDGKRNVKFIVFENGMISARKVVLANKDTIENASLSADFKNGRPFNSFLSYSNSSMALFWSEGAFTKSEESAFYRIEFSNYDLKNPSFNESHIAPVQEYVPVAQPEPVIEQPEPVKETYPFKTERNYLDPSINENYVRKLIDQINTLERSDPDLNREKIQELQAEIDEVLRVLRSRR